MNYYDDFPDEHKYFKKILEESKKSYKKSRKYGDEDEELKRVLEESLKTYKEKEEGHISNAKRLEGRIRKFGLIIDSNTDASGNCQFDSISRQLALYGEEISKEQVRKKCVEWLRENLLFKYDGQNTLFEWFLQVYSDDYNDYNEFCNEMSYATVWGNDITLLAMCELFFIKIIIISSTVDDDNYLTLHEPRIPQKDKRIRTIVIGHYLEIHYVSILTKEEFEYQKKSVKKKSFF